MCLGVTPNTGAIMSASHTHIPTDVFLPVLNRAHILLATKQTKLLHFYGFLFCFVLYHLNFLMPLGVFYFLGSSECRLESIAAKLPGEHTWFAE